MFSPLNSLTKIVGMIMDVTTKEAHRTALLSFLGGGGTLDVTHSTDQTWDLLLPLKNNIKFYLSILLAKDKCPLSQEFPSVRIVNGTYPCLIYY